jgi:hypothetical protein
MPQFGDAPTGLIEGDKLAESGGAATMILHAFRLFARLAGMAPDFPGVLAASDAGSPLCLQSVAA